MEYDLSLIGSMEFEKETEDAFCSSYELNEHQRNGLPPENEDLMELKMRLREIFDDTFGGSYGMVAAECDINEDSFRKFVSPRSDRVIPAGALKKFCIGAHLSVEDAYELFELSGRSLNYKKKSDYIFLCELENGADILEYDKTMTKYGCKPVLSSMD